MIDTALLKRLSPSFIKRSWKRAEKCQYKRVSMYLLEDVEGKAILQPLTW